jgi:hypothetical protein
MPHDFGFPVQTCPSLLPAGAKVESFFDSFGEPQWGHLVPFHLLERTRISLSRLHFPQ